MSEPCNSTDVPHFAVYTDNENRFNNPHISYVKAVHVHALGVIVSILKGGIVQVREKNIVFNINDSYTIMYTIVNVIYTSNLVAHSNGQFCFLTFLRSMVPM